MKDYHNLHLKWDVLLSPDVNSSLKNYGLCPGHHLSAPALSWNPMLNMTKVELELISDADMYFFFENGMAGMVAYISRRYNPANNNI